MQLKLFSNVFQFFEHCVNVNGLRLSLRRKVFSMNFMFFVLSAKDVHFVFPISLSSNMALVLKQAFSLSFYIF